MPTTKQRILTQARELFNEKGLSEVTLRQLAKALNMSQGNLNYHYKTRQDIVEALYKQLVEAMDQEFEGWQAPDSSLARLFQSNLRGMQHFYEYRFLLRDFYKVLRDHEAIKTHYFSLQKIRGQQFMQLFRLLVSEGIMRPEAFGGEYKRLYERLNLLGDNWINAQELFRGEVAQPVEHYAHLLFETIYPYLTGKGRYEYDRVILQMVEDQLASEDNSPFQ